MRRRRSSTPALPGSQLLSAGCPATGGAAGVAATALVGNSVGTGLVGAGGGAGSGVEQAASSSASGTRQRRTAHRRCWLRGLPHGRRLRIRITCLVLALNGSRRSTAMAASVPSFCARLQPPGAVQLPTRLRLPRCSSRLRDALLWAISYVPRLVETELAEQIEVRSSLQQHNIAMRLHSLRLWHKMC